jgi:acetylornithine deacetylase/succinyl-diaminopimelate desuccinylase-like protein
MRHALILGLLAGGVLPLAAQAPDAQREAREILAEMVSTNTTLAHGDVTPLAERLAARFVQAGVPASDVQVIGPEAKNRNLVVRIRGTGAERPVLFLAHLDVVDAPRADWSVEPFAITEKDGWLYGRGSIDDKGPATTLVAGMLALVRSGKKPGRDLILALTSGEETDGVPGAEWLVEQHRDLVDAEWVFNFDAGGPITQGGAIKWLSLQGAEKVYWTVTFTVHNAGGHSSQPRADNAIYQLAAALGRLRAFRFPIHLTAVSRAELATRAQFVPAVEAAAIRAVLKEPLSLMAAKHLAAIRPEYNALLRTTCVATMLAAGHAENALPALATATVNCRLIPGETSAATMAALRRTVADTGVAIAEVDPAKPSPPSPLLPARIAIVKSAIEAAWGKDVPIAPIQESGATDGLYFRNAGIPVYGLHGIPMPLGEDREHGNDERIPVPSFAQGVKFAAALIHGTAFGVQ